METTTNKPEISKTQFRLDVNSGMTKSELISKYGVSSASIKKIATTLGVTIKRSVTPKFILVDDEIETSVQSEVTFESLEAAPLNN